MTFYSRRLAGLVRLVISAAAWVESCAATGNNNPLVADLLRAKGKSSPGAASAPKSSPICNLNGAIAPLVYETPGFSQNKSSKSLFYCKSKRVHAKIRGVKPGVSSFLHSYIYFNCISSFISKSSAAKYQVVSKLLNTCSL